MKIKPTYIVIPVITLVVMMLGKLLTASGMAWYSTLALPTITPSPFTITLAWQIIFILATIAAIRVWNSKINRMRVWVCMLFFGINAVLNIAWSYLFFHKHMIGTALWDAALLACSVFILILLLWRVDTWSAYLLIPYGIWALFATYLNFAIWFIN